MDRYFDVLFFVILSLLTAIQSRVVVQTHYRCQRRWQYDRTMRRKYIYVMEGDQEGAIAALKAETVLNHWLRIMQEMENTRRETTASASASTSA